MPPTDRDPTHGHFAGSVDPDDDDNTNTVRTTGPASALDEDDHHIRATQRRGKTTRGK